MTVDARIPSQPMLMVSQNRAAQEATQTTSPLVQILHPSELTATQISTWQAIRATNPAYADPLLSPEFAQAVGRHRSDARVAIIHDGTRTRAFFAYHERPDGLARPIGSPFSDFHAIICDQVEGFPIRSALRECGIKKLPVLGLIDPCGISRATDNLTELSAGIIHVGANTDETLKVLRDNSTQTFKRIQRMERKISQEIGPLELIVGDQDAARQAQVFAWKSNQYIQSGLHDVLNPPWVRNLMKELLTTNSGSFKGCLITLSANGRLIAGEFGVREGRVLHPWIAAYDADLATYSPGTLLRFLLISEMYKNGLEDYELGVFQEGYKTFFQTASRTVFNGTLYTDGKKRPRPLTDLIPGDRLRITIGRLLNRIDHNASVELTTLGRLRGLQSAVNGMKHRLKAPPAVIAAAAQKEPPPRD